MRNRLMLLGSLSLGVLTFTLTVSAQAPCATHRPEAANAKPADLSGDWAPDGRRGGIGQSLSVSDIRGHEAWGGGRHPVSAVGARKDDVRENVNRTRSAVWQHDRSAGALLRAAGRAAHLSVADQAPLHKTPEAVYILHELGPFYRVVWMNAKHPEDPDPQWWGHSIGWYENGDTLVVDTIGFTDKTWLDQMGHPHTEQLHLTERYKRVDANTLELRMVIDDPGVQQAVERGAQLHDVEDRFPALPADLLGAREQAIRGQPRKPALNK